MSTNLCHDIYVFDSEMYNKLQLEWVQLKIKPSMSCSVLEQ